MDVIFVYTYIYISIRLELKNYVVWCPLNIDDLHISGANAMQLNVNKTKCRKDK